MADEDGEKHRKQIAGLKPPWEPGQSGNPDGRPKKPECISSQLRDLIEGQPIKLFEQWKKKERELTGAQIIAMAMFAKMKKGDHQLVKEGLNRMEGRVPHQVSGPGGAPVEVTVTDARSKLIERFHSIADTRTEDGSPDGPDER